jgi:MFS family permease
VSNSIADNAPATLPLADKSNVPSHGGKMLVLAAAFLGWMFDGLEMGIMPQIAGPALKNLITAQRGVLADAEVNALIKQWNVWIDAMFLFGAAFGGLVFGWLGDRIGRVKAMSTSILVYSGFTGLLYFVQSPFQMASLRCIAAIGMGGEWALGVALVMEVWDAKYRSLLAGLIGAASNVGFVLIASLCFFHPVTPSSWRWVVLAGAAPAVITFLIQIFVPESHKWAAAQKKAPSRPLSELFGSPRLRSTALLAICFASVALLGTWGAVQKIPTWVDRELQRPGHYQPSAKAIMGILSGLGAIVGCLIAPLIAARFNRRIAYFLLCLGSLASCQFLFWGFREYDPDHAAAFKMMIFVIGGITAAFYGWLPLYLPELFPTRVRATAQGIAFNFGRILAGLGSIALGHMSKGFGKMGAAVSAVYLVGMVVIWLAPETKGKPLPE